MSNKQALEKAKDFLFFNQTKATVDERTEFLAEMFTEYTVEQLEGKVVFTPEQLGTLLKKTRADVGQTCADIVTKMELDTKAAFTYEQLRVNILNATEDSDGLNNKNKSLQIADTLKGFGKEKWAKIIERYLDGYGGGQ